ncbi:MAG: DUF3887 domain-containing protein [Actinomycetota bacterium]|nr:DUF3887 domain-containing protein [Actinomycetota bacterium]
MKKILIPVMIITFSLGCILSGCSAAGEEAVSFADDVTEDYLTAINDGNFENFKKDLGEEMLQAMPEDEFIKFSSYLNDTIGDYVQDSKEVTASGVQKGMDVIVYQTDYTGEDEKVKVTIVISKNENGDYKISGSWFDSPKLREKNYQ